MPAVRHLRLSEDKPMRAAGPVRLSSLNEQAFLGPRGSFEVYVIGLVFLVVALGLC